MPTHFYLLKYSTLEGIARFALFQTLDICVETLKKAFEADCYVSHYAIHSPAGDSIDVHIKFVITGDRIFKVARIELITEVPTE